MERPPITSFPFPRNLAATAAMVSLSTGIGSGRFEPFSRYGKLNRTTSRPTPSSAVATAIMLRSAICPPAPCAQTNVVGGLMLRPGVPRLEPPALILERRARNLALGHLGY